MPQDGHLDPCRTIEVSRPKQAHTWHLTVLFTNFLGKMLSPIFLRGIPQSGGDPGGVELWELADITEPCLSLPESGLFLDVNSVRHTAIREPVFNYWSVCDGQMHVLFLQILIFLANLWGNYIFTPAYFALMKFGNYCYFTQWGKSWYSIMKHLHDVSSSHFPDGLVLNFIWRMDFNSFLGAKSNWIFITDNYNS